MHNKDHHSEDLFPEADPEFLNMVFAAVSGVGGLICGKLLDKLVCVL